MSISRRANAVIDYMIETHGALEGEVREAQIEEDYRGSHADRDRRERRNEKTAILWQMQIGHIKGTDQRVDGSRRLIDH